MRLKNILIVVSDVERSKRFYCDLFGLTVVTDFGDNVILTEGLVLQEKSSWEKLIGRMSKCSECSCELYFEENNFDEFWGKLDLYQDIVEYLNPCEDIAGVRVVRIFDPDKHLIEIKEKKY